MNILTFDIEDWFHLINLSVCSTETQWKDFEPRIHSNVYRLLETIERYDHKATFFCLGWVAEQYPEIIRRINDSGYEIGSHTYLHQLAYNQSPQQFRKEVVRSIHVLEDITGKKVRSFRAPGFSILYNMPWALEILVELGIEFDSSIFLARCKNGSFAHFNSAQPFIMDCGGLIIKEFPVNFGEIFGKKVIFSGGGYFRLLPYDFIQYLTNQSEYVIKVDPSR